MTFDQKSCVTVRVQVGDEKASNVERKKVKQSKVRRAHLQGRRSDKSIVVENPLRSDPCHLLAVFCDIFMTGQFVTKKRMLEKLPTKDKGMRHAYVAHHRSAMRHATVLCAIVLLVTALHRRGASRRERGIFLLITAAVVIGQ